MLTICPYVFIEDKTFDCLLDIGDVLPVYVGYSDEAYWELLAERWRDGQSFAMFEHDVWFTLEQYREIVECDEPWCGAKTPYFNGTHDGLGLVKFHESLIAASSSALDDVSEMYDDLHSPKHWCRLDAWLQTRVLPSYGFTKHIHDMVIGHSDPAPSHGCHLI